MRAERIADITRFVAWLSTGREAAAEHVAQIGALPPSEWDTWVADHPEALSAHMLHGLLELAYAEEDRDAPRAFALTRLVLRHLDDAVAPETAGLALVLLRGHAWRVHASAARLMGDHRGALHAYETAAGIFRTAPVATAEQAAAERAAAFTRHELGENGGAQQIIRASLHVFAAHNDIANLVRSLIFDAAIEFDAGRYEEAASIFEKALPYAESLEDHATVAALTNNLGHCAQLLGRQDVAARYLAQALKLYEQRGMLAARPRALWGLAQLAAEKGAFDVAVAEMKAISNELLAGGMPLEAACASLDMIELHVICSRQGELVPLLRELVVTFTNAGLQREALTTLSYLRDMAQERRIEIETVEESWAQLRRFASQKSSERSSSS